MKKFHQDHQNSQKKFLSIDTIIKKSGKSKEKILEEEGIIKKELHLNKKIFQKSIEEKIRLKELKATAKFFSDMTPFEQRRWAGHSK